jgi:hypothetical protein
MEKVKFKNRMNQVLPISLGGGEAISVKARGHFTCTAEQARSRDVLVKIGKKLIKEVSRTIVEKMNTVPPSSPSHTPVILTPKTVKEMSGALIEKMDIASPPPPTTIPSPSPPSVLSPVSLPVVVPSSIPETKLLDGKDDKEVKESEKVPVEPKKGDDSLTNEPEMVESNSSTSTSSAPGKSKKKREKRERRGKKQA